MTGDAGSRKSGARRPGGTIVLALAVLLLLGGGTALAIGVAGQDADPPVPSAARTTGPSEPSTSDDARSRETTSRGSSPAPGPTGAPAAEAAEPVALPASVSIPPIGVTSELITLGLNPDGTLAVPQPGPDYDKAAWFDGSPRPGDVGPAVIEGHVDSAENGPSVFYRLGELATGDRVDVTRADGSVVSFEVYEVRVVPKDDFPTLDVYGNTGGPELRLITCGGPFDSTAGSYVDNVVVFARQVV
jgi:LPXTG-site transpeptidase (sortase) family protein